MNSVALSGRLTRDPELRSTPSGTMVCSLSLAVDRAGQRNDEGGFDAGFFDISVWGNQAENCAQYLAKGSRVGVVGELRFRKWEAQDGTKRNAVDVNASRVEFMDTKAEREARGGDDQPGQGVGDNDFSSPDDDIPY